MEFHQVPETMTQLYQRVLEREPDPEGFLWYGARLWRNETNVKEVVKEMGLSPEYRERFVNHRPTEEAITLCYQHFLAREPDLEGLEVYQHVAHVFGSQPVITGLIESEEYTQKFGTSPARALPLPGGTTAFHQAGEAGVAHRRQARCMRPANPWGVSQHPMTLAQHEPTRHECHVVSVRWHGFRLLPG